MTTTSTPPLNRADPARHDRRLEGHDRRSVLARTLALLDAFDDPVATLSVAELIRRVGMPKTTVHRLVAELVRHGVLERAGRHVTLGVHLFELGCRVPGQRRLREVGQPYMQDLYGTAHEVVLLGVLDGTDTLCIVRINGHDGVVPAGEGDRIPAHATALGKAVLAFSPRAVVARVLEDGLRPLTPYTIVVPEVLVQDLARTCREGVAFEREETRIGISAVASPIFGPARTPIGALAVAGPAHRVDATRLVHGVRVAAAGIGRELQGSRGDQRRAVHGTCHAH